MSPWVAPGVFSGVLFVASVICVPGCGGSLGGSGKDPAGADAGAAGADASLPADGGSSFMGDAALSPDVFGGGPGTGACLQLGAACKATADCCSGDCANGFCNYPQCRSDGVSCSSNGDCCSQTCTGGKCEALNSTCGTLGNACASNAACCSGLCTGGTCQPSSFCAQPGDACIVGAECCTGTCNVAAGLTLGTCAASPPSGPANCGLVDGELCSGTGADGGAVFIDSGLPRCGGPCCSRACAPWGPTGVLVCQPASGCHPVGDLCATDADCCGAAGIAGGSHKPVTCDMSGGGPLGVCRLPMGCKPNGDVCKLQSMSCNSSCDCCSGNCETEDTCKQDNVGVPRCSFLNCVNAGASCASSADCCNGAPCVPNPGGTPPYVCSGTSCVAACGACTNSADCCPGTACETPIGSTQGVCGPCGGGTTDAGAPGDGGGGGDAGVMPPPPPPPATDAGPPCALYGQICSSSSQCCGGVPCTGGRCESPIQ